MFNLSLIKKLALATTSFPSFTFVYWFADEVWPRTIGDPPDWFSKIAFGCLIGIFVLVPQIKSKSHLAGRVFTLIIAPAIVAGALEFLGSTPYFQQLIFNISFNSMFVVYWTTFSISIMAVTVLVSPVSALPRLWVMTGASGLLFGLGLTVYSEKFFCLFRSACIEGYYWLILPIGLLFPMLLCLSLHFGVANNVRN